VGQEVDTQAPDAAPLPSEQMQEVDTDVVPNVMSGASAEAVF
jgi:hypothetical protein